MRFLLFILPLIGAAAWAEPEVRETRHNDWTEVCISDQGATRCEAIQLLSVNQGDQSQPILRVTVSKVNEQPFIEFALPLGMDLRSGMVVQVDQGEELRFGYSTCVPQGCAGVLQLTPELMTALKAGSQARLGFRPFGSEQVQVLEISLSGFTAASQGI